MTTADRPRGRVSARVRILLWLLRMMTVALASVATTTRSILLRDVDQRVNEPLIGLPGRDGFTVLRELREARVTVPVIVLTARDSVRDTVAGLEGGADDWMTKPFRFEELLARVRR